MEKHSAIIFDLDNTILYHTNRNPFNWNDLSGDKPIVSICNLIYDLMFTGNSVIFVTGRPESVRPQTEQWLRDNNIEYTELYMKQGDPYGKAVTSKLSNLRLIREKYNVTLAFDDDFKCADMYVEEGIITLQPLNYKVK